MWRILLGEFLGDLQAQRTRAFLTFLAVAWGTLSVVLLLAFGEGLKRQVTGGLLAAGDRIFMAALCRRHQSLLQRGLGSWKSG